MKIDRRLVNRFAGDDVKMQRLVSYWSATVLLYLLSISILWIEVRSGAAEFGPVFAITVVVFAGHSLFYILIRQCKQLGLTPSQLSMYQGRFAILCTVAGYSVMGPLRGASLVILTVILVFCAFTLEAKKTHSLSIFAIGLLGGAMIAMQFTAPDVFDAKTEIIHFVLSGSMLLVVAVLTGRLSELRMTLKVQKAELAEALEHIQVLATRDELTSLPNRRFMSDMLQRDMERMENGGARGCIALLDIDWFKKINDVHGHASGDEVLRKFAEETRRTLRDSDVLARWGGEEFLLHLPETRLADAKNVVERMRQRVQSMSFLSNGSRFGVTVSAGLVGLEPGESFELAIRRADALLYQAKAKGRNRVEAATGEPDATSPGIDTLRADADA